MFDVYECTKQDGRGYNEEIIETIVSRWDAAQIQRIESYARRLFGHIAKAAPEEN